MKSWILAAALWGGPRVSDAVTVAVVGGANPAACILAGLATGVAIAAGQWWAAAGFFVGAVGSGCI